MKDESVLDSAGPIFIAVALLALVAFTGWLMERGQGDWGETTQHAAAVAEAPSH
jgi:hypothetical protein